MLKIVSKVAAVSVLSLSAVEANAAAFIGHICSNYPSASFCSGGHQANTVPELSLTAGPLAIAVILGIVGIGLERRRRISKK